MINTAVLLIGFLAIIGHLFHIPILAKFHGDFVTMKIPTATCFILSAVMLHGMNHRHDRRVDVVVSGMSFWILLIIGMAMLESLSSYDLGLVPTWGLPSTQTIKNGVPSPGTIIGFYMVASCGLISVFNGKHYYDRIKFLGAGILLLSVAALLGYLFNVPALYFYHKNVSTAMALNTAIGFFLISASLLQMSKKEAHNG